MTDKARKFPETLGGAEVSDAGLSEEVFMFEGERLTDERADQIAAEVLAKDGKLGIRP
jgi:hypothetical protein